MKQSSLLLDFKRINGKIHKALSNSLKDLNIGVTPVQSRILIFIDEKKDVTATDILEKFNSVNKSTLSGILNVMEKNCLIYRVEDENDSRKKWINLTEKSKDIIKMLKKNFDNVSIKALKDVSDEDFELYKKVLYTIERNIDKIC